MTDSPEGLELTEQDLADLATLEQDGLVAPADAVFHPILMVWREILKPARDELDARITPQWASRIVASYQGVSFGDMISMRDQYYGKIIELLDMLDVEIATDDECLRYTTPEEDVEHNSIHYKNLLRDWQLRFLQWELDWECTDPKAGVTLAAISEVHKAFFGDNGVTQFLDNIKFEYTESDQADLTAALTALREGK